MTLTRHLTDRGFELSFEIQDRLDCNADCIRDFFKVRVRVDGHASATVARKRLSETSAGG
jgi:hypothetical protein